MHWKANKIRYYTKLTVVTNTPGWAKSTQHPEYRLSESRIHTDRTHTCSLPNANCRTIHISYPLMFHPRWPTLEFALRGQPGSSLVGLSTGGEGKWQEASKVEVVER